MRRVHLEDGRSFEVKSLKWRDVRDLKKDNLTPDTIMAHDNPAEAADAAILTALRLSLDADVAGDLYDNGTLADVKKIYDAIWAETYGLETEEKN